MCSPQSLAIMVTSVFLIGVFYVLHLLWHGLKTKKEKKKRKSICKTFIQNKEVRLVLLQIAIIYLFKIILVPKCCHLKCFFLVLYQCKLHCLRVSYYIPPSPQSRHLMSSLGGTSVEPTILKQVCDKWNKSLPEFVFPSFHSDLKGCTSLHCLISSTSSVHFFQKILSFI